VLHWLRAQEPPCPWDEEACSRAAQGGHLHVLQWLREQDPPCPWDFRAHEHARRAGHTVVADWVAANGGTVRDGGEYQPEVHVLELE
jgi:hypothetical protein